jgi:hypothetical protein
MINNFNKLLKIYLKYWMWYNKENITDIKEFELILKICFIFIWEFDFNNINFKVNFDLLCISFNLYLYSWMKKF